MPNQVFLNVNMGNRHDGLQRIATKAGIKLHLQGPKEYLVFVNSERNKIAMLVGPVVRAKHDETMAYTRLRPGHKMDGRVISEIPATFDGKNINYDEAEKIAINKALARHKASVVHKAW